MTNYYKKLHSAPLKIHSTALRQSITCMCGVCGSLWLWDVLPLTGPWWLAATECSSSFGISPVVAVAAGELTGCGWCWQPVVTNSLEQSRYLMEVVAAASTVAYILFGKIKWNLWPLDGVWMWSVNVECVCVRLEIGWWPLWASSPDVFTDFWLPKQHRMPQTFLCIILTFSISFSFTTYLCVKRLHTTTCRRVSSPH